MPADGAPPPGSALEELRALYERLDEDLRRLDVRCELRGLCCDFERSGQVLMATGLELEHARRRGGGAPFEGPVETCPHFRSGRCELREGRPLGCRVYFCDPTYADKMQQMYERYHREVVEIHDHYGVGYLYERFVEALRRRGPV